MISVTCRENERSLLFFFFGYFTVAPVAAPKISGRQFVPRLSTRQLSRYPAFLCLIRIFLLSFSDAMGEHLLTLSLTFSAFAFYTPVPVSSFLSVHGHSSLLSAALMAIARVGT